MKLIKKLKKGFTLIELVVVIAIIVILAGVSVGVYVGITNSAKESAAKQEATDIVTVVRAAVLVDADGFEFFDAYNSTLGTDGKLMKADGAKSVTAHWDVGGFIKFDYAGTKKDAELLGNIYLAVEQKTKLPGKIAEADSEQSILTSDDASVDHMIKGFMYTSNANVNVFASFTK